MSAGTDVDPAVVFGVFAASPSLPLAGLESSVVGPLFFGVLSLGAFGSRNLAGTPRAAISAGPT